MSDRESFRKDIHAELEGLPKVSQMAFIVRSGVRTLPFLAVRNKSGEEKSDAPFRYWKEEDKAKHLLSIFQAYYLGYVRSNKLSDTSTSVATRSSKIARAIRAADAEAYVEDYATANACAVYAAVNAAAISPVVGDATRATAYAAYAADGYGYAMMSAIRRDVSLLNSVKGNQLINLRLWPDSVPDDWQCLYSAFQEDAKRLNSGFEVWLDWYADRLAGKPFDGELMKDWLNIPRELETQGVAAINAYLQNLVDKKSTQPLNRVRAIFIGYGEAGKTSLIRVLNNQEVVEGKEPMTPGIEISEWPVPGSDIKAHFWDFGGQVMAHATHQFFLRERCLYVLLLNARSEINATEQAEYWLEHVRSFGGDAPIMIVGNKADQAALNLDMAHLKAKYPGIVDYYPLSCTQAQGEFRTKFESFRDDFCRELRQVGTHQMLFTPQQFAALEDLRGRSSSAFLKRSEFIEICEQHGIGTEEVQNRDWLLDILDKLGVVIHFPQLPRLDEFVLNPRWLTHGVYTLMYKRRAQLSEIDVLTILRDKRIVDEKGNVLDYPAEKCGFILDAMREFKLCYPLRGSDKTVIIPELLPTDQPKNIPFNESGALAFEFVFRGFLPRNVMPELIVGRYEEIEKDQSDKDIVWQRGVLLKHQTLDALALLKVDYHERVLSIRVQGRDAKDYLMILNDEMLRILSRMNLDYEERVELPLVACIDPPVGISAAEKANYRQLLNSVKHGNFTFYGESLRYDLKKVFGIIMSEAQQAKEGITINGNVGGINMSDHSIQVGDNVNVGNGSFVSGAIQNSFNSLQNYQGDAQTRRLLEQLLATIMELNAKVPDSPAVQDISEDAETLVKEVQRDPPRKERIGVSLNGIAEAAKTLGETAKPLWELAEQLSRVLPI